MNLVQSFFGKIGAYFNNLYVSHNYVQAAIILGLLFLLVLTLAQVRHHFVHWSVKGGLIGLFFGVLLTLIVEGFLLVNGRTALTGILGWQNAPKPISTALDIGKEKLTNVLGVATDNPTTKDAINVMQSLDPSEMTKIKAIICAP